MGTTLALTFISWLGGCSESEEATPPVAEAEKTESTAVATAATYSSQVKPDALLTEVVKTHVGYLSSGCRGNNLYCGQK